jgi:hypothetical protein
MPRLRTAPGETRADAVKTERRRRRGNTAHSGMKLGVNEEFLDRDNFEYRWINDNGGRIEQMTAGDDWDLVPDPAKEGKSDADGLGSIISKVVGKSENGSGMRAYLARKPKEFYIEDQAEKRRSLDATMDAIKRGVPQTGDASPLGANAYVPGGPTGISIKDDRRA